MFGCRTEHSSNSVILFVERSLYCWLLTLADHKVNLLFKLSIGLKLLLLLSLFMGIAHSLYGISRAPIQSNKTIKLSNCLSLIIMYCGYCLCSLKDTKQDKDRVYIEQMYVPILLDIEYSLVTFTQFTHSPCVFEFGLSSEVIPILLLLLLLFFRHWFAFYFCFFLYFVSIRFNIKSKDWVNLAIIQLNRDNRIFQSVQLRYESHGFPFIIHIIHYTWLYHFELEWKI